MNVLLQWNRNVEPDVTGYNAYRSTTSGGPYVKINTTLIPQTVGVALPTYSDTTPQNQPYYYVVRAMNQAGLESGNSNEAVALPPVAPSAPTGLTAQVSSLQTLTLLVDSAPVAMKQGEPPLALAFNLKRTSPPRDRLLVATVSVAS